MPKYINREYREKTDISVRDESYAPATSAYTPKNNSQAVRILLVIIVFLCASFSAMAQMIEQKGVKTYDFSDTSSWNLTVSAWEHLAEKDYEGVMAYAEKCLELYEEKAREMAKEMRTFASLGHEDDYEVVNDAAACHYIMGEAYMKQKKYDEAIKEFNTAIDEYPYAQCWDPKGWFWKVAEVSKKNIEKIKNIKMETNSGDECTA